MTDHDMCGRYTLDDNGEPVPAPDLMAWGRWFETANRTVERTTIREGVDVSTVFLGIDHAFGGPVPVLWETMIFGGPDDGEQWRYTSRADALVGHASAVAFARQRLGDDPMVRT